MSRDASTILGDSADICKSGESLRQAGFLRLGFGAVFTLHVTCPSDSPAGQSFLAGHSQHEGFRAGQM